MTIASYTDLVEALRRRRLALGLTQAEVDLLAGLPDGYTSKLEMGRQRPRHHSGRALGPLSLDLIMTTLCCELVMVSTSDYRLKRRLDRYRSPQEQANAQC
jgi:predicted transcriptional regulator